VDEGETFQFIETGLGGLDEYDIGNYQSLHFFLAVAPEVYLLLYGHITFEG
jgi:hypothetical protein